MEKIKDFLRSRGFYVALGTGIVAFAALALVYNLNSAREDASRQQAIDLNQPAEDEQIADNDENIQNITTEDVEMAESDGIIVGEEEKSEETTPVVINEAEPVVEDEDMHPYEGFDYDGEQCLTWPLMGDVILPYSMDTTIYFQTLDSYKCNPGMVISGEEGANVVAAYDGIVEGIEETKEYGTVVIVDMGNGYKAKYGQLMNVAVSEGDIITTSQTIGEVAPASSYFAEEGDNLYFAITKDDVPVNPLLLIQ